MKKFRLDRNVEIMRVGGGVPRIMAVDLVRAMRGLGYMQAVDRGVQIEIARLVAEGRSAEYLGGSKELVRADTVVRRMGLHLYAERDLDRLDEPGRRVLRAFVDGVNEGLRLRWRRSLRLFLRHRPRPWSPADPIRIHRLTAYLGLAGIQVSLERNLIGLVDRGVPLPLLREIFGNSLDGVDVELVRSVERPDRRRWPMEPVPVPGLALSVGSNAWAVAGRRSASRSAVLANDPHLDISQLPAAWYEVELHTPDTALAGATAPGLPGIIVGRNKRVSWGVTYAPSDIADFYVEECRDGCRRVGDRWEPFEERTETLSIRGSEERRFSVFTSPHGVLQGNPYTPGRYLSLCWHGQPGRFGETINAILALQRARSVDEARECVKGVQVPTLSWVFADIGGHIGYQLSGAHPRRRSGWSGLYPVAGWDSANDWQGFVDADELPGETDPDRGFVVVANQDQEREGCPQLMTAPMASYRWKRIVERLSSQEDWSVADLQYLQYDLLSPAARALAPLFVEHMEPGERRTELANWGFNFSPESRPAALYDAIYRAALLVVFGDGHIGRETMRFLLDETSFLMTTGHRFDRILRNPESGWYEGRDYHGLLEAAVAEGLAQPPLTWGERNSLTLNHAVYADLVPGGVRVKFGPFGLPGHASTIHQGTRVRDAGVEGVFGPSYRFVTDMASDEAWTNMPGGPSERPLSRYYVSDLAKWRYAEYKRLRVK
jgi:penicillin amidase